MDIGVPAGWMNGNFFWLQLSLRWATNMGIGTGTGYGAGFGTRNGKGKCFTSNQGKTGVHTGLLDGQDGMGS